MHMTIVKRSPMYSRPPMIASHPVDPCVHPRFVAQARGLSTSTSSHQLTFISTVSYSASHPMLQILVHAFAQERLQPIHHRNDELLIAQASSHHGGKIRLCPLRKLRTCVIQSPTFAISLESVVEWTTIAQPRRHYLDVRAQATPSGAQS